MPRRALTALSPPLIIHVLHHLVVGGMENGVVNLINHMPVDRYRHAVVCIEDYSDFRNRIRSEDVRVHAMHRSKIGTWALRRELHRLFLTSRPTIVHSRNLSGLDALLPALVAGVPCRVHSEHGWDVDNLDGSQLKPALLRRMHAPLVDRYVAVSKDIERYLREGVGIDGTRVTQIYNGVDTSRFSPQAQQPIAGLPSGFVDQDVIVIGTVGRIQAVKDQATLLRAFAATRQRLPEQANRLRLMIIGDGPLLKDLRALAASMGIAESCWMPGALDTVPEALAAMDIFVLPSLMEGTSNTILEAMASGLPVLATAVGGNIELVSTGLSGMLFRPGDASSLADLMVEYVRDKALRLAHGEYARSLAQKDFSLQAMTDRYCAVYDATVEAKRSR